VTSSQKLSGLALLPIFLITAALTSAQGNGPTLRFTKDGKPDVNRQLNLIFKTGPKGTTATAPDGTATIPGNILSANKPHTHMKVYQCPDGTLYVVEDGAEGQIPCPEKKRRRLGGFYLDDSGTIEFNEDAGTTPSSVSQNPLVTVWAGGGVGYKQFTSANTCQTILVVFPSATCNSSNKSAGFNFEGALGFTRYLAASATAGWFAAIQRNATAAALTEKSSFGPQVQTLTAQIILPIGPASIFGEGGGAFWQINMKETQGVGSGGASNSVTSNVHVSGNSAVEGAGVRLKIWPRVAVQVHYQRFQAQKGNLFSEHNNEVLFGVLIKLR